MARRSDQSYLYVVDRILIESCDGKISWFNEDEESSTCVDGLIPKQVAFSLHSSVKHTFISM